MSDRLPQVDFNQTAPDAGRWPEWREPPIEVTDALKQTQTDPYAVESKTGGLARRRQPTVKPHRIADPGDRVRAVVAQLSILLPFIGPMIAFAMSPAGSAGRRSAAKAFNGQALAFLSLLTVVGAEQLAKPNTWSLELAIFAGVGVVSGWLLQVLIAMIAAVTGLDWTSPLTRILRLRILPEDDHND